MSTTPIKHVISRVSSSGGAHRSFMLAARTPSLPFSSGAGHSVVRNFNSFNAPSKANKGGQRLGPPVYAFKSYKYNPAAEANAGMW